MTLLLNGTNGVSDVDGSASTPAIRGTDTNTGIFFPAADTIAFAEGGAEVARFDSSGNLLVGTTTSSALSTGQLQLGTTSAASSAIQMLSSTTGTCGTYFGDGTTGDLRYRGAVEYDNSGDSLRFYSSSTERMRIDSSGNLLLNTTSTFGPSKLTISYNGATDYAGILRNTKTTASTDDVFIFQRNTTQVGNITTTLTNTAYNTSSDYRLKENIAPMTGALAVVGQLKPCTYTWKSTGEASQGFIAHELQEVIPDAVCGEKDAVNEDGSIKAQSIDTSFLVATLTAAIQEQQAIITDLKARIETLENK